MDFLKMHGLGNDFVILDQRDEQKPLAVDEIVRICNRHQGVGCDQLVLMEPSENADVFARFYNADGSESGACGNATRCLADVIMNERGASSCSVETAAGVLPATRATGGLITVDMGAPGLEWTDIPLAEEADTLNLGIGEGPAQNPVAVSMGNPHCVFFVEDLAAVDAAALGPQFETHPLFPERTNVEFVQVLSRETVRLVTWERGAGLTMACGSAACAVAVAGVRRGLTDRQIEVQLTAGHLTLEWRESDGHVLMTGPVAYVFDGRLKPL